MSECVVTYNYTPRPWFIFTWLLMVDIDLYICFLYLGNGIVGMYLFPRGLFLVVIM